MDIDGLAYADRQIAHRKAEIIRRRDARQKERARLATRRTAGLRTRHARKTTRRRDA